MCVVVCEIIHIEVNVNEHWLLRRVPLLNFSTYLNNVGGSKAVTGYQKTDAAHSYGAGALNISAQTEVPKVSQNLTIGKGEGAGTSSYGPGAVAVESVKNAPRVKHEGLGQVDKKQEQVYTPQNQETS